MVDRNRVIWDKEALADLAEEGGLRSRRPRIRPGILDPDLVKHGIIMGWWDYGLYLPEEPSEED